MKDGIKNGLERKDLMYSNLLAEMSRNGYTRVKLAKHLGIAGNTLWLKLNGTRNFTITEIKEICTLFNCTFEYLFEETKSEKTA